jgi:S1-C subfamily serine protease
MRKYLLHVLIISFVFLVSPTVSFADAEAKRIYKENNNAVVMVTSYDEQGNTIRLGSGFIVKRDGVVVTNYHVIGMASDIKVKAGDKDCP